MKICPTCKGRGKQTIEVSMDGKPQPSFDMECVTCQGQRHITEKQFLNFKREQALWCRCEDSSMADAVYYDDGENPNCHKHNWCCGTCGKIVQVG